MAKDKNIKDGWAAFRYREKFGVWPNKLRVRAKKPTDAMVEFDKQQYQAYRGSKPPAPTAQREEVSA